MFTLFKRLAILIPTIFLLAACQEDLLPSNDQLPMTSLSEVGSALEFDLSFTLNTGETESLNQQLEEHDLLVLYFTMWCPTCQNHAASLRQDFVNQYPNTKFMLIDYVSSSVNNSRQTQIASSAADFIVVSDYNGKLKSRLNGTMATTIVIDKNLVIQMNETFKDGSRLADVLNQLSE